MNTDTLFWLVIIAAAFLLFIIGTVIWTLYKRLSSANIQLQDFQNEQQHALLQVENLKVNTGQLNQRNDELKAENQRTQTKFEQLQDSYNQLMNDYTELKTMLNQKELHFKEQITLLEQNKQQLKLEFEQLATQIFDAKGKAFSEQSQQSIQSLLTPFREQIKGFHQRVEAIHHNETAQKASLSQELRQLKELNHQITRETHDLTLALKGDKKMQGNWGELILDNILSKAGLELNHDYFLQKQVTSVGGKPQRPDVIIQLPKNKHVIVDSKVSLNAYTRAVNSETIEAQNLELKEHIKAVNNHIKELSERYYYSAKEVNSPELVVMFIPIEPAFIAAFKTDDTLFQKAIDRHILVATPTTLLTCLNIIKQLWRLENQSRNTLELSNMASKVYDKLRVFLNSMDKIEKGLINAQENYQEAKKQLVDGRGNLVSLVNNFVGLGVSVKNEINEDWQEKANLEIDSK